MSGRVWAIARVAAGAVLLGVLAAQVGTGPFVEGLRAVGPGAVAAALALVAAATVCSAQRWRLVARASGTALTFRQSVTAYYRSQLLNSVLPGGVVGDVHRAVAHRTVRSVVVERTVGQAVQVAVGLLVVLVAWPAAGAPSTLVLSVAAAAGVLALAAVVAVATGKEWLEVEAVPAVLGLSALAAVGHAAVFLVAARAVGVDAEGATVLALAFVVLVAAAVPLNVAGWGPREGAAAWVFAMVGLGAATGTAVATAYGVLSLVGTMPGAVLVLAGRRSAVDRPSRAAMRETGREVVGTGG